MKKICIDPGHGGHDPGALGGANKEHKEKDITLAVAKKIGGYLPGNEVVFTREDDRYIGLSARAKIANAAKADLFVSVHCNGAENASANGMEVYVHSSRRGSYDAPATRAAGCIYDRLLYVSGMRGRGVKGNNYAVLRLTEMPAVLVELGFITNDGDRAKLLDEAWQDRAALGIAIGIREALGI